MNTIVKLRIIEKESVLIVDDYIAAHKTRRCITYLLPKIVTKRKKKRRLVFFAKVVF
jgi:hypothetical protein